MATTRKAKNGVARLMAETGLSTGKLERMCWVEYPDAPAGRETIRRYAAGITPEDAWNPEIILALSLATGWAMSDISELAVERLRNKRDLLVRACPWDAVLPGQMVLSAA